MTVTTVPSVALKWTVTIMTELIKRSFELWCKKRWLKEIDRSIDRYKKACAKAHREHYVMSALINKYNELYNENLWRAEGGK